MSTKRSPRKPKHESAKNVSATATTSAEGAESAEKSKNPPINVNKELTEVLRSSCAFMSTVKEGKKFNKKQAKIIKEIKLKVDNFYAAIVSSAEKNINDIVILAQIYLFLFRSYIDGRERTKQDNENLKTAELYVGKCIGLLEGKETEREVIMVSMNAYYHLGRLHYKLDQHELSLVAYKKALELLLTYSAGDEYLDPLDVVTPFLDMEENPEYILEKLCTTLLKSFLEQYRDTKTDKISSQEFMDKVIVYKRKTLKRILSRTLTSLDSVLWISQSITFAQILIKHQRFIEARNHLTAASFMVKKYPPQQRDEPTSSDETTSFFSAFQDLKAYAHWQWAKYGLELLQTSQEELLRNTDDKSCAMCKLQSVEKSEEQSSEASACTDNTMKDFEEFTAKFTDKYLTNYADAKAVFAKVLENLYEAQNIITPEGNSMFYVSIVEDNARAYKYLTNYEQDKNKKIKLHKRRIEILEKDILKILDTRHDITTMKKIWVELSVAYSDVLDITTEKLRYDDAQLSHELINEINTLTDKILQNWKLYLNYVPL